MRVGTFHLIGAPHMQPAEQRLGESLEQIRLADEIGMDEAWVAEHHFSNYGYSSNPLLLIAKASEIARRIRFGQAVIVTPFWHPVRLAEDIALTDLLTEGRLDVGLGRGYQLMEFMGLDVDPRWSRGMFQETVEIMLGSWSQDDFMYQGTHYRVPIPITLVQRPRQRPHPPIWIACQSLETVEWVAEQGYFPIMAGSPSSWEQIGEFSRRFEELWRERWGERPYRLGQLRFVHVTDTEDEARAAVWQTRWQRRVADHLRNGDQRIRGGKNDPYQPDSEPTDAEWWDRLVYGPPRRCVEQMRRHVELGVTDFIGWFDVGGLDNASVMRSMRRFMTEVMPEVALG